MSGGLRTAIRPGARGRPGDLPAVGRAQRPLAGRTLAAITTNTTMATATRYTRKTTKEWRRRYASRKAITRNPLTADAAIPHTTPSRTDRSAIRRRTGAARSTRTRMTPKAINITAISQGWPSVSSITLSNRAPASAPGMVPTTSAQASRSSADAMERRRMDRSQAATYRVTSWRKYTSAPINVPMCSATSKVLLSSGFCKMVQPKSQGTMIRCPELETGANSVTPWVIPSTIACRTLVAVPLAGQTALMLPGLALDWPRDGDGELGEGRRVREAFGFLRAHQEHQRESGRSVRRDADRRVGGVIPEQHQHL